MFQMDLKCLSLIYFVTLLGNGINQSVTETATPQGKNSTQWSVTEPGFPGNPTSKQIWGLFFPQRDNATANNNFIRQWLSVSYLASVQVCQGGLDEAAHKLNLMLESSVFHDLDSLGSNDKYEVPKDFTNGEDDIESDPNDGVPSIDLQILQRELPEIFRIEEKMANTRPATLNNFEQIFQVIRHACSSLPSAIPDIPTRSKRSSFKSIQEVVKSLTEWTEQWVNSMEEKTFNFMSDCLNEDICRNYLQDLSEKLEEAKKRDQNAISKEYSSIMNDLLRQFSYKDSLLPNGLTPLQNDALNLHTTQGINAEDESFRMAEKVSGMDSKGIFGRKDDPNKQSLLLSQLLRLDSDAGSAIPKGGELQIEMDKTVKQIPDTFLSLAIGSRLIRDGWGQTKTQFSRFRNLASNLSPSFFRVGGSHCNYLKYDPSAINYEESSLYPEDIDVQTLSPFLKEQVDKNNIHPKFRSSENRIFDTNSSGRTSGPTISPNHPKSKSIGPTNSISSKGYASHYQHPTILTNKEKCEKQVEDHGEFRNFTMTKTDWKFLVDFIRELNWTLLFDLNQFMRDPNGSWDPTNAKLIHNDSLTAQIPVIWQLGNEPNSYWHTAKLRISPEEAVEDFLRLHDEVKNDSTRPTMIVGPDVTRPRNLTNVTGYQEDGVNDDSMEYLQRFLKGGGSDVVDAVTWHQFYVNGRTTSVSEFLSVDTLNAFPRELHRVVAVRDKLAPIKPVWISETASAWGGGAAEISDRYAGGIPWLDKLGAAALGGVSQVFRQTLYGGCYALLEQDLTPNVDFWVSVLHKQLVGNGVLLPRTRLVPETVRVYSHCLKSAHPLYKKGAIVIFAINLSDYGPAITLADKSLAKSSKFMYQLEPPQGNLKSKQAWLNGRALVPNPDGTLSPMVPYFDQREELNMSPWSMTFWVFPEAKAATC